MFGDPQVALAHFQRASEIDENYVMRFRAFDEGVWTYIGRAHYATGDSQKRVKRWIAPYRKTVTTISHGFISVWSLPKAVTAREG